MPLKVQLNLNCLEVKKKKKKNLIWDIWRRGLDLPQNIKAKERDPLYRQGHALKTSVKLRWTDFLLKQQSSLTQINSDYTL